MTKEELKARLMADMEVEMEALSEAGSRVGLTLTEIEDLALAARQRMGERMTEQLLGQQVEAHQHELPVSATSGRRLHPKGKKTKRSQRGLAT